MIERAITPKLIAALKDTPAVILHGARQTGKTTLAESFADARVGGRRFVYVTLDSPDALALIDRDPAGFVADLPEHVILDEIQLAPKTFRAIKLSIDQNRKPGRFILTGSVNALLIPRLADALVGRSEVLTLFPLAQSEIEGVPGLFVDLVFEHGAEYLKSLVGTRYTQTKSDLIKRSVTGGFPEVVTRRRNGRRNEWFSSYVTSIIQRDIRDLAEIEGLVVLPRVLGVLASRAANLSNQSELSRTLGIPLTTLKRYLALFEVTFLTQTLPAWSGNLEKPQPKGPPWPAAGGKRLVRAPKIMMSDTGLLCYLLGIDEDRLVRDPFLLGPVLENFVFMEIKKQATWAKTDVQMMHFRTHADQEVDLALERRDGNLIGIEVKSAATLSPKDFTGMELLRRELGSKFVAGVVFYTGTQVLPADDGMVAVPVSLLWHV